MQPADDQLRLDVFLAARLPGMSRARIQKLARQGQVRVNGAPARPSRPVRAGERVTLLVPAPVPTQLRPEPIPLEVLHEDDDILVIVKPAGLVVHPGAGTSGSTLVHALLARGPAWSTIGGEERPGIVHRLDKGTSGVMVVARHDAAHRSLSAQFMERSVEKIYTALVWGRPPRAEFTVDAPLGRDLRQRKRISSRTARPRDASTRFRLIEPLGRFSLLEARPRTGRTHQIRAHLSGQRLPIVGDADYGGRPWKSLPEGPLRTALESFHRLGLHAASLSFTHPSTGERMTFTASLPEELRLLLDAMRAGSGETP